MRLLQGVRQLSTTSAKQAGGEVHPGYFKLKAVQESFQVSLEKKNLTTRKNFVLQKLKIK